MKTLLFSLFGMVVITSAAAQTHTVPFAAAGNVIELEVANTSNQNIDDVAVLVDGPEWATLHLQESLASLEGLETGTVRVEFDVADDAPVGEAATITIEVLSGGIELAAKDVHLVVEAPALTELRANYPNPFSYATTIPFLLAEAGEVELSVFDLLGRRVALLVDGEFPAGLHSTQWTGDGYGSGVYLTRLDVRSTSGHVVKQGRLTLAR